MPYFLDETFMRLVVPWTDWTIWEGMVKTTLLNLIQLSSLFCGLAGISIAIKVWTSCRINAGGRKNEL